MALLWRLLIFLTGNISSLLVLQLLAYWLAFGAIAVTIRKQTGSLKLSLLPFAVAILPTSIVITGFYLKDVLMASLLCLVAALLYIGSYTKKKTRPALIIFIVSTILIIYSGTLRHNVLPALIPLAYAASFNFFSNNRKTLLATIAIIAMVPISMKVIDEKYNVEGLNPTAYIIVDDLKSILTEEEIMDSAMTLKSKSYLIQIKNKCAVKDVISFSFLMCSDNNISGFRYVSRNDYDNIKSTWINSILDKPLDYVKFRLAVFWRFITWDIPIVFNSPRQNIPQISENRPSVDIVFMDMTTEVIDQIQASSVQKKLFTLDRESYYNFSIKDLGILYRPYFWLMLGVLALIFSRYTISRVAHHYPATAVLFSGIAYFLTYIISAADYEFRFIYWSSLSIAIASTLFIAEYNKSKNNLRSAMYE